LQALLEKNIDKFNSTDPKTFGGSIISTQVSLTDDKSLEEQNLLATEYKLSKLNLTECIRKLKSYYNIPKDISLMVVKYDISLSNLTQIIDNPVTFDLFNPINSEKLNKSICDSYEIQTPLIDNVNKTLFQQLKNQSVDIFNRNDTAFSSRCSTVIDPTTGLSTTLNYRISNYFQNITNNCGAGCTYKHLDDNDYVTCQCSGVTQTDNDFINKVGDFILNGYSNINIEVILCYNQVFNVKNI
jgi:hypothetical protein